MAQSQHHDLRSCVQERGMLTGKNEGLGLHKKIIFLCDSYVVFISLLSLSIYIYTYMPEGERTKVRAGGLSTIEVKLWVLARSG